MIPPKKIDGTEDSTLDPPVQDMDDSMVESAQLDSAEETDTATTASSTGRLLTGQPVRGGALRRGGEPRSARPLPLASSRRRKSGWTILVILLVALGIAAVVFLPDLIEWRKQRQIEQEADSLAIAGNEHLHAGRYDKAEQDAAQALKLLPEHPRAKLIIDSAGKLRERQRQRDATAAAAIASAEKFATDDDIPSAIDAFETIRKNPSNAKAVIQQAEERIAALRAATGTLLLPKDWPAYTTLNIDGKVQPAAIDTITGLSFGSHTITVSRHGFRPPPPITLEFRGSRPIPLPAIAWQPVGGKVTLTSKPSGAKVWLNGKDTGKSTPCTFKDVNVGKITYLLKLAGHSDTTIEGMVQSSGVHDLTATLPELPRLPGDGKQAGERQEFNISPTLRIAFRWCPAGSFTMGGTDAAAAPSEKPARSVRLSQGFWLAETEFTQGQWEDLTAVSLTGLTPEGGQAIGQSPNHPVYFVSWDKLCGNNSRSGGILGKINGFLAKHNASTWIADLPTEAQWEYACRAGTTGAFGATEPGAAAFDRAAWHQSNSNGKTQPVGTKEANPWGFKDMHGNVFEWCRDWYQGNYHKLPATDPTGPASGWKIVVRGGSCQSPATLCRSAARGEVYQTIASPVIGFRLALHRREVPVAKTPAPVAKKKPAPVAKPKPKPAAKPKPKPAAKPKPKKRK